MSRALANTRKSRTATKTQAPAKAVGAKAPTKAGRVSRTGPSGNAPAGKGKADIAAARPTRLAVMIALLERADGATLGELVDATGWQAHSVRGALAGALKRKGHIIHSRKHDGVRRYRSGSSW